MQSKHLALKEQHKHTQTKNKKIAKNAPKQAKPKQS